MPDPDLPGGSDDPTRAQDPVDPTRAQDPIDPTRLQPGVDPTRRTEPVAGRPDPRRAPLVDEPLRRHPDDDRDRTGAWWLWALLAAVLIAIVLFALLQEGDDTDDAVDTGDQIETTDPGAVETTPEDTAVEDTTAETAPEDTTAETAPEDTTATTAAAGGGTAPDEGAGDDAGTVTTADGTDLFTLVQGDDGDAERLAPYAGDTVTGTAVEVLEVVDGEGFWIGTDDQQRIFAHAADDVAVEVGQRISFDGVLTPNPSEGADGAHDVSDDQYGEQGHHLELGSITTT